jgi:hypothetical protein
MCELLVHAIEDDCPLTGSQVAQMLLGRRGIRNSINHVGDP